MYKLINLEPTPLAISFMELLVLWATLHLPQLPHNQEPDNQGQPLSPRAH